MREGYIQAALADLQAGVQPDRQLDFYCDVSAAADILLYSSRRYKMCSHVL